jgi:hypothetical protein
MGNVLDITADDEDDASTDSKWLSISLEKVLNDSFVESLDISFHPLPTLIKADVFCEDDLNSDELLGGGNSTILYLAQLTSSSNKGTCVPKRVQDFEVSKYIWIHFLHYISKRFL